MRLGLGIGLNRFRGGQAAGILDSYTGAAFAFAPDTLIYSGFSVTDNTVGSNTNGDSGEFTVLVRRDSDNALQSFTSGEVGDGTLVTWVGAGNNGFVQVAYDQSGNGNHASQTTAANQPKIVDNGSLVVENGKAALQYAVASRLETISPYPTQNIGTHFYVAAVDAGASNNRILDTRGQGLSGNIVGWHHKVRNAQDVSLFDDGNGGFLQTTNIQITGQLLASIFFSTTTIEGYRNAILQTSDTGSIGSFDSGANLSIGPVASSTQYFLGKFQIAVLYNSDQSSNRTAIETAINTEYSIY